MMAFLQVLVAAAAVAGVFYALARPRWVFVLIMVMFPLEQLLQAYFPFIAARPQLVNYTVGTLAIFAILVRAQRRELELSAYLNPVTLLVLAFYLLWTAGLLYTIAPEVAWDTFVRSVPYQVVYLLLFPLLISDLPDFRRMLTGLLVVGSVIAFLIMVNPNTSWGSGRLALDLDMLGKREQRGNPLAIAEMGTLVAMTAALIVPARRGGLLALIRLAAFVAGLGLAIGSGSRGQVLAASLTAIVLYPAARKMANPKQFFTAIIGFCLLVGGVYVVSKLFIGQHNVARWDPLQMLTDIQMRFDMVWELLSAWLASPAHWLFGLGPSAFTAVSSRANADYVHNVAVEILCEHGLVGFSIFIATCFLTVRYGRRLWSLHRDDPAMRSAVTVLLAICLFILLLSLKQGSVSYPAPFLWWMILAKLYRQEEMVAALDAQEPAGHVGDELSRTGPDASDDYALGY